jgi:hypothetical protein
MQPQPKRLALSQALSRRGDTPECEITINLEELATPQHELSDLEPPFSEEEVWRTIYSLPSDKAP